MKKKIITVGGIIGICSELIYLFSIMADYPYSYIYVLLPLSFLEGAIILFFLDKLNLLTGRFTYGLFAVAYLILRILTRAIGITIATGVSLWLEDIFRFPSILKLSILSISFISDIIILLIVLVPLLYVPKKLMREKRSRLS